jgi:hypothetical protein
MSTMPSSSPPSRGAAVPNPRCHRVAVGDDVCAHRRGRDRASAPEIHAILTARAIAPATRRGDPVIGAARAGVPLRQRFSLIPETGE